MISNLYLNHFKRSSFLALFFCIAGFSCAFGWNVEKDVDPTMSASTYTRESRAEFLTQFIQQAIFPISRVESSVWSHQKNYVRPFSTHFAQFFYWSANNINWMINESYVFGDKSYNLVNETFNAIEEFEFVAIGSDNIDVESVAKEAKDKIQSLKWISEIQEGQRFAPNDRIPIQWTAKYVDQIDIHYRLINEFSWIELASNVDAKLASFDLFFAPNMISDSLVVRLRASDNYELTTLSEPLWVLDREKALATGQLPLEFELLQNYPNPFNPLTTISYTIPELALVTIEVFNSIGQRVDVLVNQTQNAGYYEINWSGANQTTGIYIYKLTAKSSGSSFVQMKKMTLVK